MSNIDIIHTPCKNCIFAQYDGKTQNGCFLNRIEIFKKNNVEVLEVYDNEEEFYVINKKRCLFFRDKEWMNQKNISSLEEAKESVEEQTLLKYICVLYLENDTSKDEFDRIVSDLLMQTILPKGIMVVKNHYEKYELSIKNDITPILNATSIPWRLQNFIDESMTEEQKIKAIIKSAPLDRFYYLVYPSKYKNYSFAEKINKFIQDGNAFSCININNNLFFSYLTILYAQNLKDINLLQETDSHTIYETIS